MVHLSRYHTIPSSESPAEGLDVLEHLFPGLIIAGASLRSGEHEIEQSDQDSDQLKQRIQSI